MMSFAHELNSLFFKMTISYFLFFWFFPRMHKRKNLFWAVLALVLNTSLYEFADRYFHPKDTHFWQHFFTDSLTYLSFGVVFFALYSVKNIYRQQMRLDALSQGKKEAEISALKAQINPHFLFNTLNTIYAHSLKKDEKTPELIVTLSNGFRYLFDEGQQDYVSLKQEVRHLSEYIELQQERLANKVVVQLSVGIENPKLQIAPLLLIPFVENAFKYTSIMKGEKHPINITLNNTDGALLFSCTNFFNSTVSAASKWSESGIGIANVKERLLLLYPEKHDLRISKEDQHFQVTLALDL